MARKRMYTPPVETPAVNAADAEKTDGKIQVETTGVFQLYDPIARIDIPHDKKISVIRTPFIDRQIKLKRLREVK